MGDNLRDIRNRINSVKNTKQITRAMKMVAAAKLRRAQERIFDTRPYAYKLHQITQHLREHMEERVHPWFQVPEEVNRVLLVVVTSDRGLAGAFNANITRLAQETIEQDYPKVFNRGDGYVLPIGSKGYQHFSKRDYQVIGDYEGFYDPLTLKNSSAVVDRVVEGFEKGHWDEVKVVYNEFRNTISQNQIVEPFLPITEERFLTPAMEEELAGWEVSEPRHAVDYLAEPNLEALLEKLVPRFIRFKLWRVLLESNAAEQGARMAAMDNATKNATDLLEELQLSYNRARQAAITTEILEIASGAEALAKGE